jgi:hypothetical protein
VTCVQVKFLVILPVLQVNRQVQVPVFTTLDKREEGKLIKKKSFKAEMRTLFKIIHESLND